MTPRTERGYQSLVMQTAKRFQHFWVGFSGDGDGDVDGDGNGDVDGEGVALFIWVTGPLSLFTAPADVRTDKDKRSPRSLHDCPVLL